MCENSSSVFAMRDLRLRMIEGKSRKDIGVVLSLSSIYIDVGVKNGRCTAVDAQGADAYRNL